MSHVLTVHVYRICIRFTGFQARVIFLYKKYIEFNTVANLIRLHSYDRRVSRMNVSRMAEWVRERPFGFNERAGRGGAGRGGGGEKMSLGLELFLLWRDLVFLFASYTKCIIAFTPVLDIFSWQNPILDFFHPKIFTPTPIKIKWSPSKKNKKKKKTLKKVSDW